MDDNILKIWKQKKYPVVLLKDKTGRILFKFSFLDDCDYIIDLLTSNRKWSALEWKDNFKCFESPRSWLEEIIKKGIEKFGGCYLIQRINKNEICAPSCWNATGFECNCSCGGENHGTGQPEGRWYIIEDSLAIRYGEKEYSCKLLKKRGVGVLLGENGETPARYST